MTKQAYLEMEGFVDQNKDCWLTRVNKIKKSIGCPLASFLKPCGVGKLLKKNIQGKFDKFWLEAINETKLGPDLMDHNKLRLYKSFKGFFGIEPYISCVNNRNQRSNITRLRISAHSLQIEQGRWSGKPLSERTCNYCDTASVDDEGHFLLSCPTFSQKRNCFFGKLGSLGIVLDEGMSLQEKLVKILCPFNTKMSKLVNKYISILFNSRNLLDTGTPVNYLYNRNYMNFESGADELDSTISSFVSEISADLSSDITFDD